MSLWFWAPKNLLLKESKEKNKNKTKTKVSPPGKIKT
jgi:hypothetical protein